MWYVVQVIGGQEQATRQVILNFCGGEIEDCFIPMRERSVKYRGTWKLVQEKLFPGYVFVVTEDADMLWRELKKVPRFTRMLGKTDSGFLALSEQEIEFIRRFGDEDHISHPSQVLIEEGQRVRIVSGNLLDYEGQILRYNLHKRIAVVRIDFMGSSVDVHLGIEILEKIS